MENHSMGLPVIVSLKLLTFIRSLALVVAWVLVLSLFIPCMPDYL
jgi:hypothetical protein